tara:strand:- start:222 stop:1208 length:987 start_codon:yes stop_codon:yes gene_type:complete
MKRALITGINGMDGSHLADLLLEKGYKVFGMERRSSSPNRVNTKHLEEKITFLNGDLSDQNSLLRCLKESNPLEVYNLASQSFIGVSWNTPEQTSNITGLGVLRMLEAVREFNTFHNRYKSRPIKFYQASSSDMFGKVDNYLQDESTSFYPRSPYAVAKLYGHWITKNYRESYNMFTCCGILYAHESERRGKEFVTRKITEGVAKIHLGLKDHITLGNLDAKKDWGYSPDYVEAAWLMLQQDSPDDYIVSTGILHSLKDCLDIAFKHIGISNWTPYIKQDPKFMRPADVNVLCGDSNKIREKLGWKPKTSFKNMIKKMVQNDIKLLKK